MVEAVGKVKTKPADWHTLTSCFSISASWIQLEKILQHEFRDYCVFVFTNTGLSDRAAENTIQLDRFTGLSYRLKSSGNGLCVYISIEWCRSSVLASYYCST